MLVIAVDALDLPTVRDLVSRGRLPALGALLERGVLAPLETDRPEDPSVVWGEVATGVGWLRNGLYLERVPSRDGRFLAGESALTCPTLWSGGDARAVAWFLPEPRLSTAGLPEGPMAAVHQQDRVAAGIAAGSGGGLRLVRLREPGLVARLFWDRHLPHAAEGGDFVSAGADPIAASYIRLDALLAPLLASVGEGDAVLLVSSSNLAPMVPPRALVLDVERLLEWTGNLRFRQGSRERTERQVEREASRAVVLGQGSRWPRYGRPRFLALSGRATGDPERARRSIAWVLGQVRTVGDGVPLIERVEIWRGQVRPEAVEPALVLWPSSEALLEDEVGRGRRKISVLEELVYRHGSESGSPDPPGWVLAAGPGLRAGEAEPVRPVDLTALILYLRGLDQQPGMEGSVPTTLLRNGHQTRPTP